MPENIECLLIDDDIDDQEVFLMCLEKVDDKIHCSFAENAIAAIEKLVDDAYVPTHIFIDVNMPKMNGLECLKYLKKMPKLHDTRFYMYSTTGENNTVAEAEKLGAKFLIKPAKPSDLIQNLRQVFKGS
jgi:CheY-like chemotaxis protein